MPSFNFEETIVAPRATVFDVIGDHRGYAAITPLRKVVLEREGDPAPNGRGAIRALHSVGPPIREEVTEWSEGSGFAYRVLSGLPVRDHEGRITLTDAPGGTRLDYFLTSEPSIPVAGHAAIQLVKVSVQQLIKAVKKESERRAAAGRQ